MDGKEPTYDILELAAKWHNGTITETEKAFYEQWYASFNDTELAINQEKAEYEKLSGRIYSSVEQRIAADSDNRGRAADSEVKEIAAQHGEAEIAKSKSRRLWPRIAVAAAAVAAITLGIWFFNRESGVLKQVEDDVMVKNDIAPGSNGATLTLANGKVINLSGAKSGVVVGKELKYNDGTDLGDRHPDLKEAAKQFSSGSGTIQALTATTAKGQTYQFTLPDGTKVWLNADSKLGFPSDFSNAKQRIVSLSGEGYFEVSKDKAHPFIVESDGQRVQVLGTQFNINSYADEGITKTTLLEGSVNVNGSILKPNQQATLTANNTIKVYDVDPELAVAWKNNKFMFESQDIKDIMRMVSRWYNVEVVYEGEVTQEKFGGSVSRFDNVSKVLKALESTNNVRFKVEGRRIIVTK